MKNSSKRASTKEFFEVVIGPMRICPECENEELEITADLNTFECNLCGAVWKRIKPLMRADGKMMQLPVKLKSLLKHSDVLPLGEQ
ncbi:hypothetical protein J4211_03325 [Candidatus Woesearchaeota archaeon]|nr:hypothetical protein [Candidatus Woesearchaeota archaeon]